MNLPGSEKLCQLCDSSEAKYTCPRCNKRYCTSECYKSEAHVDCSEEFYKECVETELKSRVNDPDDQVKMLNILRRHQEALSDGKLFNDNEEDDDDDDDDDILKDLNESYEAIDSDDDEEIPDLAERIKNVDMNNPDDLWAALTDAERQEFEAMIHNKETDKLLPQWVPWWSRVGNKLVTELDNSSEYKEHCPGLVAIAPISELNKVSPLLSHNLVNILYAYVIMVLHYNGEHQDSYREALEIFLHLNDVISEKKVFQDDSLAAQAVIKKSIECKILPEDAEMAINDSVNKIIRGPTDDRTYYLKAVLSDLHVLFSKVKDGDLGAAKGTSVLPKKFKIKNLNNLKLKEKKIQRYLKKIEFYLAWVDKFGAGMSELKI
ncbi:zinc finger HIT domain-containing protein 2 [Microplitis demolitor]|uniref:zinc finger HIT domain-containing protein 2 n=1 Tax=Microplitis demolitor TaxID=69319 RepID=UPI0004CD0EC7|nr:zinc finger HIT domain-containing protein 2 [Microplitis demolitor]